MHAHMLTCIKVFDLTFVRWLTVVAAKESSLHATLTLFSQSKSKQYLKNHWVVVWKWFFNMYCNPMSPLFGRDLFVWQRVHSPSWFVRLMLSWLLTITALHLISNSRGKNFFFPPKKSYRLQEIERGMAKSMMKYFDINGALPRNKGNFRWKDSTLERKSRHSQMQNCCHVDSKHVKFI